MPSVESKNAEAAAVVVENVSPNKSRSGQAGAGAGAALSSEDGREAGEGKNLKGVKFAQEAIGQEAARKRIATKAQNPSSSSSSSSCSTSVREQREKERDPAHKAGAGGGSDVPGQRRPSVKQQMEQLKLAQLRPEQRCISAFCTAANAEVAACFSRGVKVTSSNLGAHLEQRCVEIEALAAWHIRPLAAGLLSWREEATARSRGETATSPSDSAEIASLISRVFAAGILRILTHYDGSNLAEDVLSKVEDQAVKAVSTGVAMDAYRPVLTSLSRERMGILASKLQGLACGALSDRALCLRAIDALGCLRVVAATESLAAQGAQYLRLMMELSNSKKNTLKSFNAEVKHAICSSLTSSLSLLPSSRRPSFEPVACLDDSLEVVWVAAVRWGAKGKHQSVSIPLSTAIALSSSHSTMLQRVSASLSSIMATIKPHSTLSTLTAASPDVRAAALKSLAALAKGLRRPAAAAPTPPVTSEDDGGYSEEGTRGTSEGGAVAGLVKQSSLVGDDLWRAIDQAVSSHAPRIFQFCASPSIPPEAVGALESFLADCVGGLDGSGEWYRGLLKLYQGGVEEIILGLHTASMLCIEWARSGGGLGKEREGEIGRCVGEVLQLVEKKHAHILSKAGAADGGGADGGGSNNPLNATSKLSVSLSLLKSCMSCIPRLPPPWPPNQLSRKLAVYTQHPHAGVAAAARGALCRMIATSHEKREGIADGGAYLSWGLGELSSYIMDTYHSSNQKFAAAVTPLLLVVSQVAEVAESSERMASLLKITKETACPWITAVEAAGLAMLLEPEPKTRISGLRILQKAKYLRRVAYGKGGGGVRDVCSMVRDAVKGRRSIIELASEEAGRQGGEWHYVLFVAFCDASSSRKDVMSLLWEPAVRRGLSIVKAINCARKGGGGGGESRREVERSADSWGGVLPLIVAASGVPQHGGFTGGDDARVRKVVAAAVQQLRDRAAGRGGIFPHVCQASEMVLGGCARGGKGSVRLVLRELSQLEGGWRGGMTLLLPRARREAKRATLGQKLVLWTRMSVEAGLKGDIDGSATYGGLVEGLVKFLGGFPVEVEGVCKSGDAKVLSLRRELVEAFASLVSKACKVLGWGGGSKWNATSRTVCWKFLDEESGRYGETVPECLEAMAGMLAPCWRDATDRGWERYAEWSNSLAGKGDAKISAIGCSALGQVVQWGGGVALWSLGMCYSGDLQLSRAHFGALVPVLLSDKKACSTQEIIVLSLYFAGSPDYSDRSLAARLLWGAGLSRVGIRLSDGVGPDNITADEIRGTPLTSFESARSAQRRLASSLAADAHVRGFELHVTMCMVARLLDMRQQTVLRDDLFSCVGPWLERVDAGANAAANAGSAAADVGLSTAKGGMMCAVDGGGATAIDDARREKRRVLLGQLTKLSAHVDMLPGAVHELWRCAASTPANLEAALDYLEDCAVLREPESASPVNSDVASSKSSPSSSSLKPSSSSSNTATACSSAPISSSSSSSPSFSSSSLSSSAASSLPPPPCVSSPSINVLQTASVACCSSNPPLALDTLLSSLSSYILDDNQNNNKQRKQKRRQQGQPSASPSSVNPKMVKKGKLERLATFVALDQIVDGADQACGVSHRGQDGGAPEAATAGGDVCAAGVGVSGVGWSRRGWALMLISNVVDMMRGSRSPCTSSSGSKSSGGGGHGQVLSSRSHEVLHVCLLLGGEADCSVASRAASSSVLRHFGAEMPSRIGWEAKSLSSDMVNLCEAGGGEQMRDAWTGEALEGIQRQAACFRGKGSAKIVRKCVGIVAGLNAKINTMHIAIILQCLPGLAQGASPQAADALVCALKCLGDLAVRIEACKLILSPSFFWSTLALLHSTNQAVYAQAAQLMTCLLDRLDLSDHLARSAICHSAPPEWGTSEAGFKGLFPLALRGLCAESTYDASIRLLRAVTNMPGGGDLINSSPSHPLMCLVALLPQIMLLSETRQYRKDASLLVKGMAEVCRDRGREELGSLLAAAHQEGPISGKVLTNVVPRLAKELDAGGFGEAAVEHIVRCLEHGPAKMHRTLLLMLRGLFEGGACRRLGGGLREEAGRVATAMSHSAVWIEATPVLALLWQASSCP